MGLTMGSIGGWRTLAEETGTGWGPRQRIPPWVLWCPEQWGTSRTPAYSSAQQRLTKGVQGICNKKQTGQNSPSKVLMTWTPGPKPLLLQEHQENELRACSTQIWFFGLQGQHTHTGTAGSRRKTWEMLLVVSPATDLLSYLHSTKPWFITWSRGWGSSALL